MRIRRIGWALALSVLVTGCGSPADQAVSPPSTTLEAPRPPDSARAELASRAAAAKDLAAVHAYSYAVPEQLDRRVLATRTGAGDWRVDIPGGALGGAADVAIAQLDDELYHCTLQATMTAGPGCVSVTTVPPESDPRVQHVFTRWLDVFVDRAAAVAVANVPGPEADAGDGDCFAVTPSSASLEAPVAAGVYCYREDGTLTYAESEVGTLTLTDTSEAPETVDLPAPVVPGDPAPTAPPSGTPAPPPPATPTPAPSG